MTDMLPKSGAAFMVFLYVVCSSCMLVVNKASMNALPYSYTVTAMQTASSALLLLVARHFKLLEFPDPTMSVIKSWSGVLAAWVVPILFNMNAVQLVAVETMMMFRSITVVIVAWGDWLFLGTKISWREFLSCVIISCGGVMYAVSMDACGFGANHTSQKNKPGCIFRPHLSGPKLLPPTIPSGLITCARDPADSHFFLHQWNDMHFHWEGYTWGVLYSASIVFNSIYVKNAFNQHTHMNGM